MYVPLCSLRHYLQQPRFGSSPCPRTGEWIKHQWHIYTMEYYSAIKQENFTTSFGIKEKTHNLKKYLFKNPTAHITILVKRGKHSSSMKNKSKKPALNNASQYNNGNFSQSTKWQQKYIRIGKKQEYQYLQMKLLHV